jgi:hypothetical protein
MTYRIGVGAGRQVALVEDEEEDSEYMVVSCTKKARAISGTVSPATMRSVSATRVSIASAG